MSDLLRILGLWRGQAAWLLLGLVLALAIMVSDVAVNSYALHGLDLPFAVWALQLQTLFFGFLLGAAGFLWEKNP